MRPRLVVLALVVTTLSAFAAPSVVAAAPAHARDLTINVTPNPILAGQGVLIYGQLNTAPVGDQTVTLYQHVAGARVGYTKVAQTKTSPQGFFEFTGPGSVVQTNRTWFVRAPRAHGASSRTMSERVSAIVSMSASATSATTGQPVVFTGNVAPNHRGQAVLLQQQLGDSNVWQTIEGTRLRPGSRYTMTHRFVLAGQRTVRVLFPGDARNFRSASDPVALTIQQKQIPGFTISSSSPVIDYGQQTPVVITGALNQPGSSDKRELGTPLTLWARSAGQTQFTPVADTTTSSQDGSYTFTAPTPATNTVYQVRTTVGGTRHTAYLFEAVRDVLNLTASAGIPSAGTKVTLTGTVLPDKTGQPVYLQTIGPDGDWHSVQTQVVQHGSTFTFGWTAGKAGTYQFRARVAAGDGNIGGASMPVSIQVSAATNPAALPPAS